jgi:ammonium transporter Rh
VRGFFDEAGQSLDENRPDKEWEQIPLGIDDLIHGLYGATAALVGIGAILGKTTPLQQIIYVAWFIPVYGLNHFVGTWVIGASDLGGSIFVFVFGSLFGLAYAWWISGSDIKNKDIED